MRLLLDTHVVLWWWNNHPALSAAARAAIRPGQTLVWVSAATIWEISINQALGKLTAPADLEGELATHRFRALPITVAHAVAAGRLPRHHDDPFDRMLIAQAQVDHLTVVTHDTRFQAYGIPVLWT